MVAASVIDGYTHAKAAAWAGLLAELVRIPSPYEAEHVLVDHLESLIRHRGVQVRRVSMDGARMAARAGAQPPISHKSGRDCLLAVVPGRGGGRSLALCAHMDTVALGAETAWTYPPLSAHVDEQNRLFGRGAMDDKAGLALCLAVMEALTDQVVRPNGDVIFHFSVDEEITGNGSLALLEQASVPQAAVIIDGTRPDRAIDRMGGSLSFTMRLHGRPASVSVAHMGLNAAESLAALTAEMKAGIVAMNADRQPPWTVFPSPYNFSITGFHADADVFTVPDQASARCFVTFPPPASLASVREWLQHCAADHCRRHGLDKAVEFLWDGLAVEPVCSPPSDLPAALQRAAGAAGLGAVAVGPSTGASDMRHFTAAGIPCLLYGPGRGFNPHRADEHYYLDDLAPMAALFLHLIDDWCGASP